MLQTIRGVFCKTGKLKKFLPFNNQQWAKFDLLRALVRRDLESRYKGSVLGNLWPLVNQLSQLLIYTYVFAIVLKVKLSLHGVPDNNFTFGLWLFAGLLKIENDNDNVVLKNHRSNFDTISQAFVTVFHVI